MSEVVYNVSGQRFRYEVYKPETGRKFYVRKLSKAGVKVGKDNSHVTEGAAIREANRRARDEGFV